MKRSKFGIALYLLLVFVSGAVVGGFGHRLYMVNSVNAGREKPKSPEEYRRRYINEYRSRLKLNETQVSQLNSILDDTRARYREVHKKSEPAMKAIQQDQIERINNMLDDGQRAEYEKMRQEREKTQKSRGYPGGF